MNGDDRISPLGGGNSRMGSEKITIPERPIEAGVYSWGWVDYNSYRGAHMEPQGISVVLFSEPGSERSMASLKRTLSRPRWLTLSFCYGPLVLGFFLLLILGSLGQASALSSLYLFAVVLSGWQTWKYHRSLQRITEAIEVWGDRSLENYIAGRQFLRALTHRDLPSGDIFAFFNLKAAASELKEAISAP